MKKSAITLALTLALLAGLFVTLPVMADPTNGQKVPVAIQWTPTGTTILERLDSDGFSHRLLRTTYDVQLFIDGSQTPIVGTAVAIRQVLWAFTKLQRAVYCEDYEITFPTGGFEGNAHIQLFDYMGGTNYQVWSHGVFHGTGAYEGQTINAGDDPPGDYVWDGYLLKP